MRFTFQTVALAAGLVVGASAWAHGASAQSRADAVGTASALADAPIGATLDVLRKRLKDSLEREYSPLIKAERDTVRRDQLKRELPQRQASIDRAYEALPSKGTAYDVSVLTGEFRPGPGEGVLKQSAGGQDIYYLLTGDRVWKVLATLAPTADFATSALRLTMEHGKPHALEFDESTPSRPLVRVQWRVRDLALELSDRRADYGCFTLVWADAGQYEARSGDRVRAAAGRRVDPVVQDLMEQAPSDDIDNIVDKLLKK